MENIERQEFDALAARIRASIRPNTIGQRWMDASDRFIAEFPPSMRVSALCLFVELSFAIIDGRFQTSPVDLPHMVQTPPVPE